MFNLTSILEGLDILCPAMSLGCAWQFSVTKRHYDTYTL
jgi:hypothetical protein